jgi:hypothetical protein
MRYAVLPYRPFTSIYTIEEAQKNHLIFHLDTCIFWNEGLGRSTHCQGDIPLFQRLNFSPHSHLAIGESVLCDHVNHPSNKDN